MNFSLSFSLTTAIGGVTHAASTSQHSVTPTIIQSLSQALTWERKSPQLQQVQVVSSIQAAEASTCDTGSCERLHVKHIQYSQRQCHSIVASPAVAAAETSTHHHLSSLPTAHRTAHVPSERTSVSSLSSSHSTPAKCNRILYLSALHAMMLHPAMHFLSASMMR
jgi:hypothetical protein